MIGDVDLSNYLRISCFRTWSPSPPYYYQSLEFTVCAAIRYD